MSALLVSNEAGIVSSLLSTEYMIVACGVVWMYEIFLTLDQEVCYVWGYRWTIGKILFLLNRYSPIIDIILFGYMFTGVKNPNHCPALFTAISWTLIVGGFISEMILAMPTYALWGARRSILVFLTCLTLASIIVACVLMQRIVQATTYFSLQPLRHTCVPQPPHTLIPIVFIVFMVNQAVITGFTLYRGIKIYRSSRSPMIRATFQYGLPYYLCVLFLAIANVIVALSASEQFGTLLELPLRVVGSVWGSRALFLNIHGAYFMRNERRRGGVVWQESFSEIMMTTMGAVSPSPRLNIRREEATDEY